MCCVIVVQRISTSSIYYVANKKLCKNDGIQLNQTEDIDGGGGSIISSFGSDSGKKKKNQSIHNIHTQKAKASKSKSIGMSLFCGGYNGAERERANTAKNMFSLFYINNQQILYKLAREMLIFAFWEFFIVVCHGCYYCCCCCSMWEKKNDQMWKRMWMNKTKIAGIFSIQLLCWFFLIL